MQKILNPVNLTGSNLDCCCPHCSIQLPPEANSKSLEKVGSEQKLSWLDIQLLTLQTTFHRLNDQEDEKTYQTLVVWNWQQSC